MLLNLLHFYGNVISKADSNQSSNNKSSDDSGSEILEAKNGVESIHGILKAKVEKIGNGGAKTKLRVELEEGKNRHIRRLFGALKDPKFGTPLKVLDLNRVSIGSFKPNIEIGKWRYLTLDEERMLIRK